MHLIYKLLTMLIPCLLIKSYKWNDGLSIASYVLASSPFAKVFVDILLYFCSPIEPLRIAGILLLITSFFILRFPNA